MHEPEPLLALDPDPEFDDDEAFAEPSDEDLLEVETDLAEDLEPVEDEGFDISEFDEDDEGSLYADDDPLFIASDEDLPDDPDNDDDNDDDLDKDDLDSDLDDDKDWFPDSLN